MSKSLIWLHEDALRLSHPVFTHAPADSEIIFIWDDSYLQEANYSLKRLVFLYETLYELPLVILRGQTFAILSGHAATQLYIPASANPWINLVCKQLAITKEVTRVNDESFVRLQSKTDFRRFHQYWNKVEMLALTPNGGAHA
jgi:hypothetical protein